MSDTAQGLAPIASISRRDGVINQIRRAIVVGSIAPGQRLTETQLATSLGVSRPTIREALNQLAQEGLLIQEPYKGLRVAEIDEKGIRDLAETRIALDVLAIQEIYKDPTDARLGQIQEAWDEFKDYEFDADPFVRHEAHVAFHKSIWLASENSILIKFWPVLEAHLTIALAHDSRKRADLQRSHQLHQSLVTAIMNKDIIAAEAACMEHTLVSAEELVTLMSDEH